eukprot:874755-Prorocentrum_minimum.AAC.4
MSHAIHSTFDLFERDGIRVDAGVVDTFLTFSSGTRFFQPKEMGMGAQIQLMVVNFYLNVFGGFEGGIKFLVDTMFPSKIKGIFAGLFASYKEQVTVAMGGDEVSATTSTVPIVST